MNRVYHTNGFYRFFCFTMAVIVLAAGTYSFYRGGDHPLMTLAVSAVLSLIFSYQAFFMESFIFEPDRFTYNTRLLNITLKLATIPYRAIVSIERFQNVQFITRFVITCYNDAGQLSRFYLRSFTLFSSVNIHPNIDKIIRELSTRSGIPVKNRLE